MLLIVSLGMAMAVPSLSDWQEERQLDLAAYTGRVRIVRDA